MADVFAKLVKDGGPLGQHMERAHGYFAFPKLEGELGPRMTFRGKERWEFEWMSHDVADANAGRTRSTCITAVTMAEEKLCQFGT